MPDFDLVFLDIFVTLICLMALGIFYLAGFLPHYEKPQTEQKEREGLLMKFTLEQAEGLGGMGYRWTYSGGPDLGSLHVIELAGHISGASGAGDAVLKALDEIGHRDPRMKEGGSAYRRRRVPVTPSEEGLYRNFQGLRRRYMPG